DDGRFVGRLLQLEDVDAGAVRLAFEHLDVRVGGDLAHHLAHRRLLDRLVGLVDRLADRGLRRYHRQDLQTRHERDVVEGEHVRRIGHRQRQRAADPLDREDLVLPRDRSGDETQRLRVDVDVVQRDGRDAVLPREEPDELLFGDEAEASEDGAEFLGLALLLGERLLELRVADQPFGDQQIPKAPGLWLTELRMLHLFVLLYSTYPLQCVGKGSVRIVQVKNENHSLQRGFTRLEMRDDRFDHGVG